MDIKIERDYYALKMADGMWHIWARDRVIGPTLTITETALSFTSEAEAEQWLDKLNNTNNNDN